MRRSPRQTNRLGALDLLSRVPTIAVAASMEGLLLLREASPDPVAERRWAARQYQAIVPFRLRRSHAVVGRTTSTASWPGSGAPDRTAIRPPLVVEIENERCLQRLGVKTS